MAALIAAVATLPLLALANPLPKGASPSGGSWLSWLSPNERQGEGAATAGHDGDQSHGSQGSPTGSGEGGSAVASTATSTSAATATATPAPNAPSAYRSSGTARDKAAFGSGKLPGPASGKNAGSEAVGGSGAPQGAGPVPSQPEDNGAQPAATQFPAPSEPEPPKTVTINVTAVGDCTLGYDDKSGAEGRFDRVFDSVSDPSYFFSGVADVFGADDLTIANLEGVFTESTQKASKAFCFHGDPGYAAILTDGSVEAVNLANNHTMDYFQRGYDDTKATLDAAGVAHFGGASTRIVEIKGVRVGLAGIHAGAGGWSHRQEQIDDAIASLDDEADITIFSVHWGVETKYAPTGDQKSLARHLVDNGADLVIGHHPHTLQGIETYKGRTIAYSLGNFCFGGNRNPKDKDTAILTQSFEFDMENPDGPTLASIGKHAALPASVTSTPGRNDYRPCVLSGDEGARVSAKIAELSAELG